MPHLLIAVSSVWINKLVTALAAVVIAMGLLLGTAAAQAEPTVEQEGSTATAIRNLPIGDALYDVEFMEGPRQRLLRWRLYHWGMRLRLHDPG